MPPKGLPFKCGTPGCGRNFERREQLIQHTKDSHSASKSPPSKSPPKQETFKSGAPGCETRPPYPQHSMLLKHSAEAHPKSKKTAFPPSGSFSAPVSMIFPSQPYVSSPLSSPSYVHSPLASPTTYFAAQNAVSPPSYTSSPTHEEVLERFGHTPQRTHPPRTRRARAVA
ncbi:hypothetical protein DFH06DRAFT_110870 [Mycena polygramma]|nr:hypothetical protein DFH06DRAFT_110870 [Mycena polygramma]